MNHLRYLIRSPLVKYAVEMGARPVQKWVVDSESQEGVQYTVTYSPIWKRWACTCAGAVVHGHCKHIERMKVETEETTAAPSTFPYIGNLMFDVGPARANVRLTGDVDFDREQMNNTVILCLELVNNPDLAEYQRMLQDTRTVRGDVRDVPPGADNDIKRCPLHPDAEMKYFPAQPGAAEPWKRKAILKCQAQTGMQNGRRTYCTTKFDAD